MEVRQPGRAAAGLGTFSGEDRGLTPAALNDAPADGRGKAGFPLVAAKWPVRAGCRGFWGAMHVKARLYALWREFGVTLKSFCFSVRKWPLQCFAENFRV